ncbi:MAG: ATP-binding protein [Candidatus Fermentibacteria bacterium]
MRVGFYENYPKVFTSDTGIPSGIFVDILDKIADTEGWTLQYVHGNWSECLQRLESGEIDLMVDVAYSDARDEIYDFCENNIVSNWAQVYTREGIHAEILTDLDSMSIATLRGGIHLSRLEGLLEGFGLSCEIILADDYETVFSLLDQQEVDAGVVNRVFGHTNADRFNITRSPVVFSPASLRYAVRAGSNPDLIAAIDEHLIVMKENHGSIYHQSIRRWLGETSRFKLPQWIPIVLASVGIIILLLVSVSILLRYQVKKRTADLRNTNSELIRQIEETMRAHLELKHSEEIRIHRERLSALGQMVSGIAHDFNNMIMPILGYSDLLIESSMAGAFGEKQQRFVQIIRSSAADARDIVRRLQEFIRADTRSHMEHINVAELISETVSVIRPALNSKPESVLKPIEITEDVPADLVIIASGNQLKEALMNLLLNSVDAIREGGKIKIHAFTDEERFFLEVSDSGTGMSRETVQQCIEPFFSTKGSDGTGMGLAMVHGIVKRHNGELNIESSPGSGTTVTIQFPLDQEITGEGTDPEILSLPVESMSILVIDDDISSLNLISEYLKHDGHSVTSFSDPVEGMSAFNSSDFDMIITDMVMPRATGEDVTLHVKNIKPGIPVLMVTGFAQLMSGRDSYPDNVDCLMGKPFTLEELRKGIRKAYSSLNGV